MHTWKMIYSLIRFHSVEPIALNGAIAPEDVPVFFVGICQLYVIDLGHAPYYWIVAMIDINVESPVSFVLLSFLLFDTTLVLVLGFVQIVGRPIYVNGFLNLQFI